MGTLSLFLVKIFSICIVLIILLLKCLNRNLTGQIMRVSQRDESRQSSWSKCRVSETTMMASSSWARQTYPGSWTQPFEEGKFAVNNVLRQRLLFNLCYADFSGSKGGYTLTYQMHQPGLKCLN